MFKVVKILVTLVLLSSSAWGGERYVLLQSTTSTQNSGLYEYLLPIFTAQTGIEVRVVAVGTGQAIRNSSNGDADVLLVHAKSAEEAFVASGNGVKRFDLMYNDFVIIGHESDPLGLSDMADLGAALTMLAQGDATFVSRGDDSGTHKMEQKLWEVVGQAPAPSAWYRETGAGMGATLRMAVEMLGYALTDRATWISYADKSDMRIVFEDADALLNQYGIIAVNPARHPHVNAFAAGIFIAWMLGAQGQALIGAYTLDGQQLFYPNAE